MWPVVKNYLTTCYHHHHHNRYRVSQLRYLHFPISDDAGDCCWWLLVAQYPERVYQTATGVMCLDFSRAHPNLLAVSSTYTRCHFNITFRHCKLTAFIHV